MFENLRIKAHHFFLKRRLQKQKVNRTPVSYKKAKSIGIIYDALEIDSQKVVRQYKNRLLKHGKSVETLAYYDDKNPHDEETMVYFNRKNLSWTFNPKGSTVENFINTNFDILIDLHLKPSLPLEYVSALSKANLRVGQFHGDNEHCYDLMIDTSTDDNLQNLVGQIDFFLKTINKDD